MYLAAFDWRKSIDIDSLYMNYDWAKAQQAATVGYRQYFHVSHLYAVSDGTSLTYDTHTQREDKSGSPIHIHELHTIDLTRVRASKHIIQFKLT